MHGPPKPVPKVIETEPPKPLKSILKKKYVDPENERKVDFNRVAQKAQYAPFEDEDPFQNQDSTKSSHFSLKWFGDKPKDKGNTDTTDDNHPDNHPDSHPDNQPTFDIQEVPINDSGDTTSKQPDDEVPSQNKISTESSDLGVREIKTPFKKVGHRPSLVSSELCINPCLGQQTYEARCVLRSMHDILTKGEK
ncbi:hypothetical protein BASA83_010730 [Batrachochytrium salamandrivorans]|nr:hypothetical protein BASA83_010730 [Batrachochytrium salamandrivorans]